jgi:hypothetical protein
MKGMTPTTANVHRQQRVALPFSHFWKLAPWIRPVGWPPGTGKTTPGYLYPTARGGTDMSLLTIGAVGVLPVA